MFEYPSPPPLSEFGPWRIPDGRPWTLGDEGHDTHDSGCVAIAPGPDGWMAVADTKNPHQQPLIFNQAEWTAFVNAISEGSM